MKIGVLSDTHDRLDSIDKAVKIFKDKGVEMIVHCGDWVAPFSVRYFIDLVSPLNIPIKGIFGNNDGDIKMILQKNRGFSRAIEFPIQTVLEIEMDSHKIAVYHGQDEVILDALIKSGTYKAVLTGHTHEVRNEVIGDVLVLNPGATCFIIDGQVSSDATVAIYDSGTGRAEIIHL